MKFGVNIPKSRLESLEARAHRLAVVVDQATSGSADRTIRTISGQLVDRIFEWMEEIKELLEVGDEEVVERIRSFQARLSLAEKAVGSWPKRATAKSTTRRRRRPKAKAA